MLANAARMELESKIAEDARLEAALVNRNATNSEDRVTAMAQKLRRSTAYRGKDGGG